MSKDIEVYLGTDGERYEFLAVPDNIREKIWQLPEPYKVVEGDG